ncbi:ABC transporter permease subunit [Candidatus Sumerlaeota bacterium]|nr:ABC transporter permease subunit [Candidatus Sumerlaeota bacterium]
MARYILQRIIIGIVALFTVSTATFFLMHAVPGDPLRQEKAMVESVRLNLEAHYGLDKPLLQQYVIYMKKMFLHGDFGISFKQANRSVNDSIKEHFWVSALLGVLALGFSLVFGVLLGIVASLKRNTWVDYSAMIFAVLGLSVPSFVLAYLLQYVFALKLNMLPVAGWEGFPTMILPSISLGMIVMAAQSRLMRSSMLETLQQDYIKTAKAKGLSPFQITFRHQIRNAILPVVVYTGPLFAIITTGSFVIESIFGIPGLGRKLAHADEVGALVQSLDEPEEIQLTPEWRKEIRRRLEAFDKGEMEAIPAEEVFERLRNKGR